MKKYITYVFILLSFCVSSQENNVLSLSEYLAYVKKYHPIVKQADLLINESEAKLMKARGAFDPKLEVDYNKKQFKETEYYDKLNTMFKIPTWYGVEIKGGYENNSGTYLNPENKVPDDGLYNVGISVSLAKGLLINERMATLKQAKIYTQQAKEDNKLAVNNILYKASLAYFKWLEAYRQKKVYEEFLLNAETRLKGIKRSYELGEKPAIDTTEAKIIWNDRKLNLEKSELAYNKAILMMSNYLWIEDTPVEIQDAISPDLAIEISIDETLKLNSMIVDLEFNNHPKLQSLSFKKEGLETEKRLKKNNLLPDVNLQYNFLSDVSETTNSFDVNNYKIGLTVNFPLFLRKERADLKLTDYKIQAVDYEAQTVRLSLKNKLSEVQREITSYENQLDIVNTTVSDYTILLKGEERKFQIGESTLFLINDRETKLINSKLKKIEIENLLFSSKGKLFNLTSFND